MKVKIRQKYVYHKVGIIEIDIDRDIYQDWIKENNYNVDDLDYYLSMNEELWVEQIHEATDKAEFDFGSRCYKNGFNEEGNDEELRYYCKELKIGGHL